MTSVRLSTCLVLLSLCGCAWMRSTSTTTVPAGGQVAQPTQTSPPTTPASPAAQAPDQPASSPIDAHHPDSAVSVEHPAPVDHSRAPGPASGPSAAKAKPPERPIKPAEGAVHRAPSVPTESSSKPASTPALDLADLEQRLRETHAIGVFTKLSLKNQVDDLLNEFRALYKGSNKRPTPQLRERYDLLILKVLSLLQDSDPALAAAISSSREAIWGILSDPDKFEKI